MLRITCADLLARGDLAVHDKDPETLARVATLLSRRIGDPLTQQLRELAWSCRRAGQGSLRVWPALRAAVADRISLAGT